MLRYEDEFNEAERFVRACCDIMAPQVAVMISAGYEQEEFLSMVLATLEAQGVNFIRYSQGKKTTTLAIRIAALKRDGMKCVVCETGENLCCVRVAAIGKARATSIDDVVTTCRRHIRSGRRVAI